MSLLFRIVYAAHANGTHHKLALDALARLRHPQAEAWQRLFLRHAALYLEGSKDPDNKFKDFKNHVLHVRDGYWGGAPEKVQNWYQHTVAALQVQNWSEAVYAAGVLSHYFTDPIHPFHTGQTEAENNIHRAVEWSINRSYDALKALGDKNFATLDVAVPSGESWLRDMTLAGADYANRSYEKLIAHYDITRGVVDPPAGLDPIGRTLVAELIMYASAGFARILDRAIVEGGQAPPEVSLTAETVIAGLQIPAKMLQKRLTNAVDRDLVQRMYDELKTTGTVDKTLPEDDRTVRDLFAVEVLAPRTAAAEAVRQKRLIAVPKQAVKQRSVKAADLAAPPAPAHGGDDTPSAREANAAVPISNASAVHALEEAVLDAERACANRLVMPKPEMLARDATLAADNDAQPVDAAEVAALAAGPAMDEAGGDADVDASEVSEAVAAADEVADSAPATIKPSSAKVYLAVGDDIERAPSIGPKTAQRLADVGVTTVQDFLEEDAEQLATMLGRRALTARVLKDWQDQARLVMAVPGLRGTHAQLLVGAGYRNVAAIAAADADLLCAAIVRYAMTSDGKSVLRDGAAPDIEKIKAWMESAALALAA